MKIPTVSGVASPGIVLVFCRFFRQEFALIFVPVRTEYIHHFVLISCHNAKSDRRGIAFSVLKRAVHRPMICMKIVSRDAPITFSPKNLQDRRVPQLLGFYIDRILIALFAHSDGEIVPPTSSPSAISDTNYRSRLNSKTHIVPKCFLSTFATTSPESSTILPISLFHQQPCLIACWPAVLSRTQFTQL